MQPEFSRLVSIEHIDSIGKTHEIIANKLGFEIDEKGKIILNKRSAELYDIKVSRNQITYAKK